MFHITKHITVVIQNTAQRTVGAVPQPQAPRPHSTADPGRQAEARGWDHQPVRNAVAEVLQNARAQHSEAQNTRDARGAADPRGTARGVRDPQRRGHRGTLWGGGGGVQRRCTAGAPTAKPKGHSRADIGATPTTASAAPVHRLMGSGDTEAAPKG